MSLMAIVRAIRQKSQSPPPDELLISTCFTGARRERFVHQKRHIFNGYICKQLHVLGERRTQ